MSVIKLLGLCCSEPTTSPSHLCWRSHMYTESCPRQVYLTFSTSPNVKPTDAIGRNHGRQTILGKENISTKTPEAT
eukprot:3312021-Amphidinium_carterae.1